VSKLIETNLEGNTIYPSLARLWEDKNPMPNLRVFIQLTLSILLEFVISLFIWVVN
jgi:hypothetical protein